MLRYFISREFFLTILGLVLLGVLVYLAIFFVFLPSYTRHGDSVLVPEVDDIAYQEATKILEDAGLRYEVRDCTYIADLPSMTVISQYPVSLSKVKPHRKVYLTLNKRRPPMVKTPQVINLSFSQAKSRLESWKLQIGVVTRVPDVAENVILEAYYNGKPLKPGLEIPQGSKINLVVADGSKSGRNVELPNLVGLSYQDALNQLRSYSLSVGAIVYDPSGPVEEYGQVYRQNPSIDTRDSVRVRTPIDIYVYGEEPETTEAVTTEEGI